MEVRINRTIIGPRPDLLLRCANWDFARRWTKAGGVAYVGLMAAGIPYVDNVDNNYCTEVPGLVCHEDEIFPIVSAKFPDLFDCELNIFLVVWNCINYHICSESA